MKWTKWAGLWAAGMLGWQGCGKGAGPSGDGTIQKRLALQRFASCNELETYIEDSAVFYMKTQLEASRDVPYGVVRGGDVPTLEAAGDNSSAGGSGTSAPSAPSAYTTTNTQVQGVDEADFVKNDGTRIYTLNGNQLHIHQSWPAEQLKTLSSLTVEGYPREMFLDEANHVVVFSTVYVGDLYTLNGKESGGVSSAPAVMDCAGPSFGCGYYGANALKVTVINVANSSSPKVEDEYYLPGEYSSSRRIGASIRFVLNDQFRWPNDVQWYPANLSYAANQDPSLRAAAFNGLIASNEKLLRAQSLKDWLPESKRRRADGSFETLGYDCTDFQRPNASTRLGLLTVGTVNLANPGVVNRTSIVADTDQIYASSKNLYVANGHWWWRPEVNQVDYTYLHQFDITDPDRVVYVASGGVEGTVLNQFSMDEDAQGNFRVATTLTRHVPDVQNPQNTWGVTETANRVSVLRETEGQLPLVGQTEDLAPGERIFSARFFGPRAYVVTFRQVDPFFTIDLSDPAHPRKVGELKIPGFSTYLHPVDENHVLAIGSYISENNDWQTRAIKLSLFDVSDFANPKEKFSQLVGNAYSSSEAQYDHKAFNYFPEKKLLAIPFATWGNGSAGGWSWSSFTSDLRVFHIDTAAGITPKGALSVGDVFAVHNYQNWSYFWTPVVRRSVMADDFVYAISDAGIRVAALGALQTPLATVLHAPAQQ